ncbi:MAG: tryptophan synthase subunit alpha [Chloroflexi bacterium]|nr:tryptophan synthase subunit alpha [Chloroflexota bacterium]
MTTVRELHGTVALAQVFASARAQGRAAFLPYFPIGYPTYQESLAAVAAMADEGADGFEIGIPFSDPIADGPTIQAATQVALENGTTVRKCLDAVRTLRAQGISQPMLMMGYANPLVAYGTDQFVRDARAAGADGLIVPDLPPEEAAMFADSCAREGLALVFFLAPTSNDRRIEMVARHATGFIYVVSLTGITGERAQLPTYLREFIARWRARTDKPLVLGFGISRPEHARQVSKLMDGFIVGSALVRAGGEGVAAVRELTSSLRRAL